ncbi:glycoside hydrolase family 43 protein [Aggregatilinea lenta]|uniref:glycoside hydrolase family 43 protein n=1 Tax=Aggregatilinea lenta TaxID=913108 RepID=UPI0013C3438C|nr:glycoside hydrolase family 43 protein [Aggregatilinea lenta]
MKLVQLFQARREFKWGMLAVLLAGALLALIAVPLVGAQGAPTFTNPIQLSNGADPWIVYYEGNYYLTTTVGGSELYVRQSPTLGGLKDAPPVLVWEDETPDRCCNMWSPELHLLDGEDGPHWYLYYTAGPMSQNTHDTQYTHVLESEGTDPLGPYIYKARVFDPVHDTPQLDATVMEWQDELYFLSSVWDEAGQSLYIAPMSNPWTISGDHVRIASPMYAWEKVDANINEAPAALEHDGELFLTYSASSCASPNYALGMLTLTGDDVLDPGAWTKSEKPVFQRADENDVFGPGHNGFFKSPDGTEDWIVYHANDSIDGGCDDQRTTRAQPITWNEDGTPDFGAPVSLDTELPVPSGEVALDSAVEPVVAETAEATAEPAS